MPFLCNKRHPNQPQWVQHLVDVNILYRKHNAYISYGTCLKYKISSQFQLKWQSLDAQFLSYKYISHKPELDVPKNTEWQ